jgi:hypothetical protein
VRLLGTVLYVVAGLIAAMALLIGAAMVVDPDLVRPGLLLLVLVTALAAACAVVGRQLRREAVEAAAWGDADEEEPW